MARAVRVSRVLWGRGTVPTLGDAADGEGADGDVDALALVAGSGALFFVQTTRPKREALWKLPLPKIGDQATPELFFMA